jgi:DNA-directed RNA polymerase subunit K/omega
MLRRLAATVASIFADKCVRKRPFKPRQVRELFGARHGLWPSGNSTGGSELMAERTITPANDIFLIWTGIIASITTQFIFTLVGLGAGIIAVRYAPTADSTVAWYAFAWWAATGVFAAAVGGVVIGALGQGIDDAKLTVLALIAWAGALLIVAFAAALAAGAGASVVSAFGGPLGAALDRMAEGKVTPELQRQVAALSISSVVVLMLGAAVAVAGAIYAPEAPVRTSKRA